jgi:integrase
MPEDSRRPERLTKRTVDAAAHGGRPFVVWDTDLKGFGLKVAAAPGRTKTFIVKYRVGGGRTGTQRQFKIGTYGALTPDKAREKAERLLAAVALGEDPQAARAEDRKALTVAALCDVYLAEGVATKAASTVALDEIRLEVIKRLVGRRKATQLTAADVERMRDAIATGRVDKPVVEEGDDTSPSKRVKQPGDRARGGRTASTKAVKLLRAIYAWAIDGKRLPITGNPTTEVKTFADNARERFLSPAELGRLGDVLTLAEAEPDPKGRRQAHVRIIRLLLLTGARKNEIATLRWSEVQTGYLQLETSKTGRKVVPLGAAAQEVLTSVPRGSSVWVFPDPKHPDEPIRNLDWAWVGIRKRAGLDDVRVHDLRHSFASVGVAGGAALFLMSKLLGHRHPSTTQRYAHLADDPVKAAADKISSAIDAAMKGRPADVRPVKEAEQ